MCQMLATMFRRIRTSEVDVVTCLRADEAIRALRTAGPFDIVLSDFLLGTLDGLDVLEAARRRDPLTLRILLSGLNELPVPIEKVKAAQADVYLLKPVNAHDVLLLVIACMQGDGSMIAEQRAHARELEALAERCAVKMDPADLSTV